MPKNKGINLLPQEEFDTSIVGRVLRWAMGTFRIIVIVTEMVVMGAFLSRFWLDAQNSDLTEEIQIRTAQIDAQKDFETEFRNLQKKLTIFNSIDVKAKSEDKLGSIAAKIPSDVKLVSVSVTEEFTQVKGVSQSESSIAQFVANLRADEKFKKVELGGVDVSNDDSTLTSFTVKVDY